MRNWINCIHGKPYTEPCEACAREWAEQQPDPTIEELALRAQRAADFCRANPGLSERYVSLQITSLNHAIAQLARIVMEMKK